MKGRKVRFGNNIFLIRDIDWELGETCEIYETVSGRRFSDIEEAIKYQCYEIHNSGSGKSVREEIKRLKELLEET